MIQSKHKHKKCQQFIQMQLEHPPFHFKTYATVYREIFAPLLISPLSPSLSLGKYKIGRIPLSQTIFSLFTTSSGQIQDEAKLFASEKGRR